MTPEGVQEKPGGPIATFERTARNASLYGTSWRSTYYRPNGGSAHRGAGGPSDLDFILEYVCERHALTFFKTADPARAEALRGKGALILRAERARTPGIPT